MTTTDDGHAVDQVAERGHGPAEPDRGVVEVVDVLELVDAEDQRGPTRRPPSARPAAAITRSGASA